MKFYAIVFCRRFELSGTFYSLKLLIRSHNGVYSWTLNSQWKLVLKVFFCFIIASNSGNSVRLKKLILADWTLSFNQQDCAWQKKTNLKHFVEKMPTIWIILVAHYSYRVIPTYFTYNSVIMFCSITLKAIVQWSMSEHIYACKCLGVFCVV